MVGRHMNYGGTKQSGKPAPKGGEKATASMPNKKGQLGFSGKGK